MDSPRRVLVVAAHADDETLGCGATLRRLADDGAAVFCVSLTDGVSARGTATDGEAAARRRAAAEESARLLGFRWLAAGDFPDNELDRVPLLEVVRFVESAKREVRPHAVYTHHGGDLNVDHRISFQAVLTAFRPQPAEDFREIYAFEVASSTEWGHSSAFAPFEPNVFVDVETSWEVKRAALRAYGEELRPFPHARSLEAIDAVSLLRGAQAGLPRAEAFQLIRAIVRKGAW